MNATQKKHIKNELLNFLIIVLSIGLIQYSYNSVIPKIFSFPEITTLGALALYFLYNVFYIIKNFYYDKKFDLNPLKKERTEFEILIQIISLLIGYGVFLLIDFISTLSGIGLIR